MTKPTKSRSQAPQHRMVLRPLELSDYPALVALGERCFPRMKPWSREQIESQLKVFPKGQVVR